MLSPPVTLASSRRNPIHTREKELTSDEGSQRSRWMLRVQAGDREAYRALLEDVCAELRALLQRRLSGGLEVDDVLQEILLTLHRARHTYDPGRPFNPWLHAIARNAATDAFRRARGRLRWERLAGDDAPIEAASDDAGRETSLVRVLARLPKTQRSAIEMVKLQGMSVAEAAQRAGIAPGAMRVRVHRGYRALRELLLGKE